MSRDTIRGLLIVLGLAIVATVFSTTSRAVADAVFGAIGLIFICLMWYFGYRWYRENRMAISLMPDRQRNVLYAGMGAVTVSAKKLHRHEGIEKVGMSAWVELQGLAQLSPSEPTISECGEQTDLDRCEQDLGTPKTEGGLQNGSGIWRSVHTVALSY